MNITPKIRQNHRRDGEGKNRRLCIGVLGFPKSPAVQPVEHPTFETVWAALQETDRIVRENAQGMKELKESQKETDRQLKETDRIVKEVGRKHEETDRIVRETAENLKETERVLKEQAENNNKSIGSLTNLFGDVTDAQNLRKI